MGGYKLVLQVDLVTNISQPSEELNRETFTDNFFKFCKCSPDFIRDLFNEIHLGESVLKVREN